MSRTNKKHLNVMLLITDRCDRMCPTCCFHLYSIRHPQDRDVKALIDSVKNLSGVDILFVSGGEPTLHQGFHELTKMLSKWRPSKWKRLVLVTNGARLLDHVDCLPLYDEIRISLYSDKTYIGAVGNEQLVKQFVSSFPGGSNILISPTVHITRDISSTASLPCGREMHAGILDGRLYPCCVAPYIPEAMSVPVKRTWRKDLRSVPLPCEKCRFAINAEE